MTPMERDAERMARALEAMAKSMERISAQMAPSGDHPEAKHERERLLAIIEHEAKGWRYRNIVFDGMDAIHTAVVPLTAIERVLSKAFHGKWGYHELDGPRPADGEQVREDSRAALAARTRGGQHV